MPRPPLSVATLCALWLSTSALADEELTPERIAAIQHDEQKAIEQVNQAHGNKLPSEMEGDERREVIHEQQTALQDVLEKHQVEAKEYAVRTAKLTPEERDQVAAATRALEEKEAAEKRAAEKAATEKEQSGEGSGDVVVRRGFGEDQPVDVSDSDEESQDEAGVTDLPPDDAGGSEPEPAPPPKPSSSHKKQGKKHRSHD